MHLNSSTLMALCFSFSLADCLSRGTSDKERLLYKNGMFDDIYHEKITREKSKSDHKAVRNETHAILSVNNVHIYYFDLENFCF